MEIAFTVKGKPVSKSNSYKVAGRHLYKTTSCKEWEANVANAFKAACVGLGAFPLFPKGSRCRVIIKWFKMDARRQDVDNIVKSILDSLNGLAWADDNQVVELNVFKYDKTGVDKIEIEVMEWQ